MHRMSAALTLQGAVAHCDMPLDSGPTMLLPYSQRFPAGYVALPARVHRVFRQHQVQIPVRKGDAVFFNPALYHGAGANTSGDIRRMANLLQVSSPFGRAMESLDRTAMVRAIYPRSCAMRAAGRPAQEVPMWWSPPPRATRSPRTSISDQPIGSLAPPSQVDPVLAALRRNRPENSSTPHCAAKNKRKIP